MRLKTSLGEELPKFEANHMCEKLFGPKRGEATDFCAEMFAVRSEVLSAVVLRVLPIVQQHSAVGFLSHCGEKQKTNTPQNSGRG